MRRLAATLAATLTGFALFLPPVSAAEPGAPTRPGRGPGVADEVPVAGAQAGSVEAQRLAGRASLVGRLDQLATWCNDKELFIERDRLWRKVLEIAPDDAAARKGLRYARNVDGSWKEPAPREVKNIGKKWLEELAKRESEAFAPYGDVLLALARAPERAPAERDALVAEIRAMAPNHAGLHAWLGDVQLGDRWVMPETATAKERRGAIRAEAKRVMEVGAPIAPAQAGPAEAALGVTWKTILQGENVRVLSTGSEEETLRIARACEGAGALLTFALGSEMRYPAAYTVYVLGEAGEKEAFLAKLPDLSDAERTRLAALDGTGIPRSNNVALFGKEPARRIDAAVRHTIGNILGLSLGVSHKTAWAWEGIGQYLTRELVGTRLTWFVSEAADPASAGLRGKLMTPESNWIQEAYDLLANGTAVPLDDLMLRDLDRLDVPGALTGYAFVAYLLEGQPAATLEFVTRSARGDDPAAITGEVLKRTPAELQERLVQWLAERR
ncbi:MAG: hypothetical protein NTY35_13505 [Planctomycetota bacterium]|nr:hypothetical protein [Planctomycetota bacterium]